MPRLLIVFSLLIQFFSVAAAAADSKPRILAIGDSLLAWQRGRSRSIPEMLAKELREPVRSHATMGARMIYGLPISGAMGMNIPKQYRPNSWDWVVISGGGNDMLFGCGCSKCDAKISRMVSGDGRRGVVPNLVRRIRQAGAHVIVLGYLRSPGVKSVVDKCRDEGNQYEARLAKMARAMPKVYFLSNAKLVAHGDRSFHAGDMVHPSLKATAVIGKRIAKLIRRHDPKR